MATKFYKCSTCGNDVVKVVDSGVPLVCCGAKMEELIPNTVDASGEKHVPVATLLEGGLLNVKVGSVAHPMEAAHHIAFIYVETERGGIRVDLNDKPEATIYLGEEKAVAVYEYCPLHGLWKSELYDADSQQQRAVQQTVATALLRETCIAGVIVLAPRLR